MIALIGAPLSQAINVRSPSKSMTKSTSSASLPQLNSATSLVISNQKTAASKLVINAATTSGSADCKSSAKIQSGLLSAADSQLKRLAQYEQVCGSGIITQLSFFVATPTTIQEARAYAADVATKLREFSDYGITPLVFLEPTTSTGLVNMADYQSGAYDLVLDTYFAAIKAAQITDAMMGTWVPFPEGNLPVWTSLNPNDFAMSVTKTVTYQKKYFPNSKASILLDTLTYPTASSWSGGRAISLLPYVQTIPAGLIDSFGLQGFPWSPAANEGGPNNGEPHDYLRVDFAVEAARVLHVHDVWLNTGTFSVKYANQPMQRVTVAPEQRLTTLTKVVTQAKTLQSQGFAVSIHLFADDKSHVAEATDWSYWPNGGADASPSTYVFKTFVHELQATSVPLWLFDADE